MGFRINRAVLKVVEPYQKEYVVTGYGRCGNTGAEGLKADFCMWRMEMLSVFPGRRVRSLW